MDTVKIDPVNDGRWLEFISACGNATIFQHPLWLRLLNKQYGFPVFALCVLDENKITAGIPFAEVSGISGSKKWVSLPFSDYCGPLYKERSPLEKLVKEIPLHKASGKAASVEFYSSDEFPQVFNTSISSYRHVIKILDSEEAMMKSFDRTKKQGIAKSYKEGLTSGFRDDYESIKIFYDLHLKTRKKLGIPVQPKKFFTGLYETIYKGGKGFTVIVKKDNINIAAGVFLEFNGTIIYKYNASDQDYLHYRPNNLIIWEALRHSIAHSYKYFDFGKTDTGNEGLRKFKLGWNAEESILYRNASFLAVKKSMFGLLKDKVVSPLIRRSPRFVCRWIGEIGYRYFASV